jgi:hypothetical protein
MECEDMVAIQGGHPPFKGDSPHMRPQPSRTESSPTRSKVLPLRHGGWVPRVMQTAPGQKAPNRRARSAQRPSGYKHSSTIARTSGRKSRPPCRRHATTPRGRTLPTSPRPAWRPRPTRHVTGAPVTTCEKLHRHSRQSRASSTAEPVPQLEATLRTAQQCQPGTLVTGQSAAGEGATVDTAKNGPAVMAMAGGRKQQSNHLQAHVPSWNSERTLSYDVKTTRPCSIPRTARARTTAAPRTTRPVALTLRHGRRHLWQAKRATLHLRHNDCVKKVRHDVRFRILFHFLFLSLATGTGKGDTLKGILLHKGNGPRAPLLIRGSKAGPSEGFDSRLRALGLRAHY